MGSMMHYACHACHGDVRAMGVPWVCHGDGSLDTRYVNGLTEACGHVMGTVPCHACHGDGSFDTPDVPT